MLRGECYRVSLGGEQTGRQIRESLGPDLGQWVDDGVELAASLLGAIHARWQCQAPLQCFNPSDNSLIAKHLIFHTL